MKLLISGLCGHMGKEVAQLAQQGCCGSELTAGVDAFVDDSCTAFGVPCAKSFDSAVTDVDCIIDFSHHTVVCSLLDFAVQNRIPAVIATTGHTEEEKQAIASAAEKIPVFYASNFSLGIALLIKLAKIAAAAMPDAEIEIIEKHHDRKLDAPSGTALTIAKAIKDVRPDSEFVMGRSGYGKRTQQEIGIHSIRMGNIVGEHEVLIGTQTQTITLKHEANSRAVFAEGALNAADWLLKKGTPGLYDMNSMLAD